MKPIDFEYLQKRFLEAKSFFVNPTLQVREIDEFAFTASTRSGSSSRKRAVLVALTHGNEVGGIEAIYEASKEFAAHPSESVEITFALSNIAAAKAGKRFIERDLNRSFGVKNGTQLEHQFAKRIESICEGVDLIIDFHQTVEPSEIGFFIVPFSPANLGLAETICGESPLIVYEKNFSADGQTLTAYALENNIKALTYEAGALGIDPVQVDACRDIFMRLMTYLNETSALPKKHQLFGFSSATIQGGPGRTLRAGFKNFTKVKRGEEIGSNENGPIIAADDGAILFPKYGTLAMQSAELCRIVVPISRETLGQKN